MRGTRLDNIVFRKLSMRSAVLSKPNRFNHVIGVVGGGQLAQMLVQAARKRNVGIVVQTSSRNDPAASEANRLVLGDPTDIEGTRKLLKECFCITFENEWVNIAELSKLEKQNDSFLPRLDSLDQLVNKISQRKLLAELNIPGPDWILLTSNQIAQNKLPSGWDFPLMAKASIGGYDGKGTRVLKCFDDLKHLYDSVEACNWLIEKWVPYERELALVVSRDLEGRIRSFPLAETNQLQQVCNWVLAPADVSHLVETMAYNIASSLLTQLNYVGVLAIEFFYGPQGLQVNEIAPRTHNSAHFSIEACNSSQFDQQVCIAAGLQVQSPQLIVPGALMVNLLGLPEGTADPLEERLDELGKIEGINLHWYGKEFETPGRKLGHATLLLKGTDAKQRREEAFNAIKSIRSIWPSP